MRKEAYAYAGIDSAGYVNGVLTYSGTTSASSGLGAAYEERDDSVGNIRRRCAHGVKYEIQSGGPTVSVTISPSATATTNVPANQPNCRAAAEAYTFAAVTPVQINISGTKPDAGADRKSLIGMQQVATMSGGVLLRNFSWSVSGPQIFGSVTAPTGSTSRKYESSLVYPHSQSSLPADEGDQASFYASKNGSETVACTAEAVDPVTGDPLGTVSATRSVRVLAPDSTLVVAPGVYSHTVFTPDATNPDGILSSPEAPPGDPNTEDYSAIKFTFSASAVTGFEDASPVVNLCQTLQENDTFSSQGYFGWVGYWLDDRFPYYVDQPANNGSSNPYSTNDTPANDVSSLDTSLTINEQSWSARFTNPPEGSTCRSRRNLGLGAPGQRRSAEFGRFQPRGSSCQMSRTPTSGWPAPSGSIGRSRPRVTPTQRTPSETHA